MKYTLSNILANSIIENPVKRSKVINESGMHILLQDVIVILSTGNRITIPKGFKWDLASVPQILHNIIREHGDDDIAYLIHDYLYIHQVTSREFADREMLKWAKAMRRTDKLSIQNIDIYLRYYVVRAFGSFIWNK